MVAQVPAAGALVYVVLIVLVVAVAVVYLVARARQGEPPKHAAEVANEDTTPHDEDPTPSDADGMPFRGPDGSPLEPGEVNTTDQGRWADKGQDDVPPERPEP